MPEVCRFGKNNTRFGRGLPIPISSSFPLSPDDNKPSRLVMAFVDITEDNISELMKSKDGKSTQRAVTRSIKLFRDFFIHKNEPGEFETYTKPKTGWDVETFLCINQKNRWWNDEKKFSKRLGAIKVKIGPTSDIDKIFSKMYSQYVLFRNKYS